MLAAKRALNRFLLELLGPDDEVFLYRFDSNPELVHGWTTDRQKVSRNSPCCDRAVGIAAMYDAVAEAIPLAQTGKHRKKALVVISDGNDQNSQTAIAALQAQIRERPRCSCMRLASTRKRRRNGRHAGAGVAFWRPSSLPLAQGKR